MIDDILPTDDSQSAEHEEKLRTVEDITPPDPSIPVADEVPPVPAALENEVGAPPEIPEGSLAEAENISPVAGE